MGERAEFISTYENMGLDVWSVDDQIADIRNRIVRCKDCKHYSDHEWIIATDVEHVCHFWHGKPTKVEPEGYCKWGERK